MSSPSASSSALAGPAVMFLSAAIFGYFGFLAGMTATTSSGEFVLFFAILLWTLRISAVLFAVGGLLTFASPIAGNMVYLVASALSALGLLAVGVMDVMDDKHAAAVPPVLAFIFAAWNGYGVLSSAGQVMSTRRNAA